MAKENLELNLCISILEFKSITLIQVAITFYYLCISILEFKYWLSGISIYFFNIYVFLYQNLNPISTAIYANL